MVAGLLNNLEEARQVIRIRAALEFRALPDAAKPFRSGVEVEILNHFQVQSSCHSRARRHLLQTSRIPLQQRNSLEPIFPGGWKFVAPKRVGDRHALRVERQMRHVAVDKCDVMQRMWCVIQQTKGVTFRRGIYGFRLFEGPMLVTGTECGDGGK